MRKPCPPALLSPNPGTTTPSAERTAHNAKTKNANTHVSASQKYPTSRSAVARTQTPAAIAGRSHAPQNLGTWRRLPVAVTAVEPQCSRSTKQNKACNPHANTLRLSRSDLRTACTAQFFRAAARRARILAVPGRVSGWEPNDPAKSVQALRSELIKACADFPRPRQQASLQA